MKNAHEIHVSEIRDWKRCRWAHDWKYIDRLYPRTTAKALEFGTAMHSAYEAFFNPETWELSAEDRKSLAIAAFIDTNQTQKRDLIESIGKSMFTEEMETDYSERLTLGVSMMEYYANEIHPKEDSWFEPIFVEKSFAVPVTHPDGTQLMCVCNVCQDKIAALGTDDYGLPVVIEGKIDLIVKDKTTDKYWIFDWKNVATIADEHSWLELDEQLNTYLWAMSELGLNMAGFQYHEQRKGFPQRPKRLERKYRGAQYSTSKDQDTTFELFLETVVSEDNEAFVNGVYDDYLTFLKNEGIKYFERTPIRKSQAAIDITGELIYKTAVEMITAVRPNNVPSPTKFGCRFCEFKEVCIERRSGADYQSLIDATFVVKEHYYDAQNNEKEN